MDRIQRYNQRVLRTALRETRLITSIDVATGRRIAAPFKRGNLAAFPVRTAKADKIPGAVVPFQEREPNPPAVRPFWGMAMPLQMQNAYGPPGWAANHSFRICFRSGDRGTRRIGCCFFDFFRSRMTTDSSPKSTSRERIDSEGPAPV